MIKCERSELTDPITIASVVKTPDGQGGVVQSYVNLSGMPCYARVRAKRGQAVVAQGAVRAQTEYEVTIRRRLLADIKEGQRVTWNGVQFRVAPPVMDSWRSRWLTFTMTSGVAL